MSASRLTPRRCRLLAAAIIVAATLLRIAYLYLWCPYDLAPDEAHYWDWSRHLDWSYYSKGPLVAWIIRAGCEVFGGIAVQVNGTLMPAVRTPAVFCGSGLLAAIYVLTYQTYRSDRLALATMAVALSFPPFAASSVLMTIDGPFLCCWGWALVFGHWAFIDGKSWAWPLVGLFVCLGILAKYTMALWLFSAGLFFLFTPTHRALLFRLNFWIMVAVAGLSALPILYWNSQNDWVSFRHVAVQAGVAESKKSAGGLRWLGPLQYVAEQFALLLGYWFVLWSWALFRHRPNREAEVRLRYLWWLSLPTFAVFGASSIRAAGQMNWPVAAYLSGAILVAGCLRDTLTRSRPARIAFIGAIVAGSVFAIISHDTRLVSLVASRFVKPDTPTEPTPIRAVDPAARLKGHRYLASELDRMRREFGDDPVLAGFRWNQPGLLGFYCDGHPQAHSLGLILRIDRHSQYDLWRPNPVDDAQAFRGRTFLVVGEGDPRSSLDHAFEAIDAPRLVVYTENGRAVARWVVCVCRGFKGFDPSRVPQTEAGH